MRKVPGVTVLGHKTQQPGRDGRRVSADVGRRLRARPSPGCPTRGSTAAPAPTGRTTGSTTDPLERSAVESAAVTGVPGSFDIFATHEPVAADHLRSVLPDRIRQTNSGHTHTQNAPGDLQSGDSGRSISSRGPPEPAGSTTSTAAAARPPIEFSIETVGDRLPVHPGPAVLDHRAEPVRRDRPAAVRQQRHRRHRLLPPAGDRPRSDLRHAAGIGKPVPVRCPRHVAGGGGGLAHAVPCASILDAVVLRAGDAYFLRIPGSSAPCPARSAGPASPPSRCPGRPSRPVPGPW